MKKIFITASVSLVIMLMASAASVYALSLDFGKIKDTVSKVKRATGKMSVEEEVKIGDSVAAQLLGAGPLVDDPALQHYVNKIGMWVAQQSERKDLPWLFGVMDSDNINAFATPGGRILITKGLFFSLSNEAELAGVLGHEIAHVVERHHLNALKKNARLDLLADVVQHQAKEKNEKAVKALVNAGTQLYARGLDRKLEYDADRIGVVYATRAGYDPYALLGVLTTLDSINVDSPTIALINKTHPSFSDRLNQLDRIIEGRLDKYARQPQVIERLLGIQQSAFK